MLTDKQVAEIHEHLEKAQNPVFYYDNDADGLCSYVLLRRFIDRGKGVAVRSFPDLNEGYARKAAELNADYVFVLDKPVLSKEFVEAISDLSLPIVWIDHHDVSSENFSSIENFFEYNSAKSGDKKGEPVTYLSYKISGRKEDAWLGVVGCIADHYLPDFASEFAEKFPEFWKDGVKEPFDAYFGTEIGRIARAVNFGLKDSITNVIRLQNFLISCKGPAEVFEESGKNQDFRKKYLDIKVKYEMLLRRARMNEKGRILFFEYSGDLSISADLANELSYLYSKKYIVVAYVKGNIANLSMRGKNVRDVLAKVLKVIFGSGGGHEGAVGARISASDLKKFREVFEREIGEGNQD